MSQVIEQSEFDTAIFGVRFLRVSELNVVAVGHALSLEDPDAPLMVDVKVPTDDADLIEAFRRLGFHRAATLVELHWTATEGTLPRAEPLHKPSDLTEDVIAAHARQFKFQRFQQDGAIPRSRAIALMHAWIRNSLNGRREVIASGANFCSYAAKADHLVIDLLSCLDRGAGNGGRLLRNLQRLAAESGRRRIQVVTEAENSIALRTYVNAGFVPQKCDVALHLVRNIRADDHAG